MSLKGSKTKSDFMNWNTFLLLVQKLERDNYNRYALLISIGTYCGLRISDVLKLRWQDILDTDMLELIEKKTKKQRNIKLHEDLKAIIRRTYKGQELHELVFINRFRSGSIRTQFVNDKFRELFSVYNIKGRYTSHFMRKTLGRRVWEQNNHSEKSLFMLSQLFNHSSIQITKIYLGIREEEIQDIYLNL